MNFTKSKPKVALGTKSWGGVGQTEIENVFDLAMEHGLNLWDTADSYAEGDSEETLGEFVRNVNREDIIISAKFTPDDANSEISDAGAVQEMFNRSMNRMNIDYADIYWLDNSDDVQRWIPALLHLARCGQIGEIGLADHSLEGIKKASDVLNQAGIKVAGVQNHFSLLSRTKEVYDILNYCKENDMTFYAYRVLEQGALSGDYDKLHPFAEGSKRADTYNNLLPQMEVLLEKMREIGREKDISAAQVAIAWAISKGTLPIIGVTKVKHVEDCVNASKVQLTDEEITELEDLADQAGVNTLAD